MVCKCSWASAVLSSAILKWHLDFCFRAEMFLTECPPQLILCSCGDLESISWGQRGQHSCQGTTVGARWFPSLGRWNCPLQTPPALRPQPVPGSKEQDKRKGPQVAPGEVYFGYWEKSLYLEGLSSAGTQVLDYALFWPRVGQLRGVSKTFIPFSISCKIHFPQLSPSSSLERTAAILGMGSEHWSPDPNVIETGETFCQDAK